jgi:hypothetical protein
MATLTEKDYCDYDTSITLGELGFPLKRMKVKNLIDGQFSESIVTVLLYEAQKWLREEKKLFIEITIGVFDQTYLWEIYSTENSDLITGGFSSYDTYEEALSEGVREAVKLLKEK